MQPVPVPVQTMKLASVFGSVILIGALRSAPLIMIFEVSAFANNSTGSASKRRLTNTDGSRFTVHPHILPQIRSPQTEPVNSLDGSRVPHSFAFCE